MAETSLRFVRLAGLLNSYVRVDTITRVFATFAGQDAKRQDQFSLTLVLGSGVESERVWAATYRTQGRAEYAVQELVRAIIGAGGRLDTIVYPVPDLDEDGEEPEEEL